MCDTENIGGDYIAYYLFSVPLFFCYNIIVIPMDLVNVTIDSDSSIREPDPSHLNPTPNTIV